MSSKKILIQFIMKCAYLSELINKAVCSLQMQTSTNLKNASGSSDGKYFSVDGSSTSCVTDNALKTHDDHFVMLPESLSVQDGRG